MFIFFFFFFTVTSSMYVDFFSNRKNPAIQKKNRQTHLCLQNPGCKILVLFEVWVLNVITVRLDSCCEILYNFFNPAEPPTIELDFRDKIVIRVEESCLLQGRYTGKPSPTITWFRDEDELKADKHVMFKNTPTTMSLGLMKAKREHSGKYVVLVENSTGSRKGVCNVTVVGM